MGYKQEYFFFSFIFFSFPPFVVVVVVVVVVVAVYSNAFVSTNLLLTFIQAQYNYSLTGCTKSGMFQFPSSHSLHFE